MQIVFLRWLTTAEFCHHYHFHTSPGNRFFFCHSFCSLTIVLIGIPQSQSPSRELDVFAKPGTTSSKKLFGHPGDFSLSLSFLSLIFKIKVTLELNLKFSTIQLSLHLKDLEEEKVKWFIVQFMLFFVCYLTIHCFPATIRCQKRQCCAPQPSRHCQSW